MDYLADVKRAIEIVDLGNRSDEYSPLYFSTNEPINELFSSVGIEDKEVLTVLASSDQYFYSCFYNAKSIDTFDKNRLTIYYYYLRKWEIEYLDRFYPDKKMLRNHKHIHELLQKVKPESEEETDAYQFWDNFIRRSFPFSNSALFYFSNNTKSTTIEDLNSIKSYMNRHPFSFEVMDIFEPLERDKQYDIIILSNILEYCGIDKFEACRDNLLRLLRDDGIILCSNVIKPAYPVEKKRELELFQEVLDYSSITKGKKEIGYTYQKNSVNKK